MKRLACAVLVMALVGCGGSPAKGQLFNVGAGTQGSSVEGFGADLESREYDAIAYAVSRLTPGGRDDLALDSPTGLNVTIDDGYGHNRYATVHRINGVLHIVFTN